MVLLFVVNKISAPQGLTTPRISASITVQFDGGMNQAWNCFLKNPYKMDAAFFFFPYHVCILPTIFFIFFLNRAGNLYVFIEIWFLSQIGRTL